MKKTDALARADAARHAAKLALARHALYATTFGGNSELAQKALLDSDTATEAANQWERIAQLHHATRAHMLRTHSIPTFMFGY